MTQNLEHGQQLRESMGAVRLNTRWFGTRRSVSPSQKTRAALTFEAETAYISMGKKLIDTKHPAWQKLVHVRNRMLSEWRCSTLPYPENGLRLINRSKIDEFTEHMEMLREELRITATEFNEQYDEIRRKAKERLGSLYSDSDYPESFIGLFDVSWDFPSVEPPAYLQSVNPNLYKQECERIQSRFTEAVSLAENAFLSEFTKLISHLTDRLSGSADGKPKKFKESVVTNLKDFFDKFQNLNIGSNEELESLVNDAQRIVGNLTADELKDSEVLRNQVAEQLSTVRNTLDGMMVDRPRRNLLRRQRENQNPSE